MILFVGAGEISGDHGEVTNTELQGEPQLFVDAVRSGCNNTPKLLLVPPPMLVSHFPESKHIPERHEILRTSMRVAAEQNADTEFVDLGEGYDFKRSDFCSESGKCDTNHFCRNRPGKTCPLLENVTISIAEGMKHAFAVPEHVRHQQVGVLGAYALVSIVISSAAINCQGYAAADCLVGSQRKYLPQVSGLRFMACIWILAGHFIRQTLTTTNILERGPCAVSFFVVLSGFMTHYVYGPKLVKPDGRTSANQAQTTGDYLVDRFARIVPVYYLGISFALAAALLRGDLHDWLGVGSTLLLIQSWTAVGGLSSWASLNGPLWTLSSLSFAWICYPAMLKIWRRNFPTRGNIPACLGAMLAIQCLLIAAMTLTTYLGSAGSVAVYDGFRMFPLQITLQFLVGCFAAEMLSSAEWAPASQNSAWIYGALGDLGFLSMPLLCAFLPRYDARCGVEIFFTAGFALLQANLLVLSVLAPGFVARFAAHKVLAQLGNYSFAIYALQDPVATIFATVWQGYVPRSHALSFSLGGWSMFAVVLSVFSGVITESVEPPMVLALKNLFVTTPPHEEGSAKQATKAS